MGSTAVAVQLKLLIDQENNRVLFAEAGKKFVDFLFHILALPVGKITQLVNGKDMVGSIGNVYTSIENLDEVYMKSQLKGKLLEPTIPWYALQDLLSLPAAEATATKNYYRCGRTNYRACREHMTESHGAVCPSCGNSMTTSINLVQPKATPAVEEATDQDGYVKDVVTYMVLDDLTVKPMSTISCISLLTRFNIKDLGVLEEKEINVSMKEAVKLLKASLQSKRVLTDTFLGTKVEPMKAD